MSRSTKMLSMICAAGVLAGCAETAGLGSKTLLKGSQIGVRALIEAHPNQTACTDYDAATQSCASLIKGRISGDTLIATETALARGFGPKPERIDLVTRSKISNGQACVGADGISLGKASRGNAAAGFVLEVVKDQVADQGGLCATYYTAGEDFVVSTRGGDGRVYPPGDTALRFFSGPLKLRVQ